MIKKDIGVGRCVVCIFVYFGLVSRVFLVGVIWEKKRSVGCSYLGVKEYILF